MKIEKAECSYQVTECDLKFGEQIVLDGELLIPASVLDKIKGYVDHIRNTGMGKKKSLDFIEKFIEGLKAESEEV